MRALLSSRAMMAVGAYAIGWVLAPVLALDQIQQEAPRRLESASPAARLEEAPGTDAQLAAWLLVDHESALAISEIARERAQDDAVQQLAQIAVTDYTRLVQQLRPFAGTMLGQLDQASRDAARAAKAQRARPHRKSRELAASEHYPALPAPRERSQDADLYLLELKRSLGQQRITSTHVLFEEQTRSEFDLFYLEQQIASHREMLDTLLVCEGRASTELAAVIAEAISTLRAHGERADQLVQHLDESAPETTSLPLLSRR